MSDHHGRYAMNSRDSPIIAWVSAATSRSGRPRNAWSSGAPSREESISAAVRWSIGNRRIATSRNTSAATPPRPTAITGPNCGSSRTPTSISTPSTISCTRKPSAVACASCARSRSAMAAAAARTASGLARCSATPPTSVLWLACAETIFTATGKPTWAALAAASSGDAASAACGGVRPCCRSAASSAPASGGGVVAGASSAAGACCSAPA
jgi:hypothetical protein